jgi:hypothetical protein
METPPSDSMMLPADAGVRCCKTSLARPLVMVRRRSSSSKSTPTGSAWSTRSSRCHSPSVTVWICCMSVAFLMASAIWPVTARRRSRSLSVKNASPICESSCITPRSSSRWSMGTHIAERSRSA